MIFTQNVKIITKVLICIVFETYVLCVCFLLTVFISAHGYNCKYTKIQKMILFFSRKAYISRKTPHFLFTFRKKRVYYPATFYFYL